MNFSNQALLSELRNKNTERDHFRYASDRLSESLAYETYDRLPKEEYKVITPISETKGAKLKNSIVLVPILRSGLAMLYPFLRVFDHAKVGFFGMRRDEKTHEAKLYYENLPEIKKGDDVLVLDPMLATGGSAFRALSILTDRGVNCENLYYVGMVAAPEGLERIQEFPITTVIASIDERLNENKFIVPGLGDFGDRYFGTD